jgi:hypothetical protein
MKTELNKRGYCLFFLFFFFVIKALNFLDYGINAAVSLIITEILEFGTNCLAGVAMKNYENILLSALETYFKNKEL